MTLAGELARWSRGWRGPAIAAAVAFLAGLPGLLTVPPLDRDESRFAQATTQMLETHDFVVIRYQDQPRFKKPVGIHWLQAASVSLLSSPESRQIWAYRIPSLLGAMLAAAACAWGAAAFFNPETGLIAGALLGSTLLLSTEAFIAKTDAALCGCTTLAMAALGRIYLHGRGGPAAGKRIRATFWAALAAATLIKGPIAPLVAALAIVALTITERRARWLARLKPYWGFLLFVAIVGPWAWAVTVATDGSFWSQALASDLAPKLAGGQETHGAPPGYHTLLAPILMFPMTLLLPAAAVAAWTRRDEPGVRFALAWLVPTWIFFEILPTKLVHYPLPAYGAVAWLAAAGLRQIGRRTRITGAALAAVVGVALGTAALYLARRYGDTSDLPEAVLSAVLLAGAGLAGGWLLLGNRPREAAASAVALGVLGHAALAAGLAPRLTPLWLSDRTQEAMGKAQLLPSQGLADAPVTVTGYAEPSLVFALGTETELGSPDDAAEAIVEHRPAVVDQSQDAAFQKALKADHATARVVARVQGLDYSDNKKKALTIYMSPAASGASK